MVEDQAAVIQGVGTIRELGKDWLVGNESSGDIVWIVWIGAAIIIIIGGGEGGACIILHGRLEEPIALIGLVDVDGSHRQVGGC